MTEGSRLLEISMLLKHMENHRVSEMASLPVFPSRLWATLDPLDASRCYTRKEFHKPVSLGDAQLNSVTEVSLISSCGS